MKNVISMVLVVTAMFAATFCVSAQARPGGAAELKQRILEQIKSGRPADRMTKQVTVPDEERAQSVLPQKNALAGTWDLVLTFSDGSQVRSTLQIMPGAVEGEGSALHASEFSLVPPNPTLPEQGSWRHLRGDQFLASYYGYSFDDQLQPFGKIGFRSHVITINFNPDYFTGRAVFEVLDGAGNVLFSDNVETAGSRQRPLR